MYNIGAMLTIKLKLRTPNNGKSQILNEYLKDFTACASWWLRKIQKDKTTSRTKLHHRYYHEARGTFNSLPSANIQCALDKAIETQRAYWKKKGNKSLPQFKSLFGCFRNDTFKIENNAVRLTVGSRKTIWLPLIIPDRFKESLNLKFGRSEVKRVRGQWYLYLTVKPEIKSDVKSENVLGVDIGVAKLAVISTPDKKINKFFSGEETRYIKNHYHNLRKKLQAKLGEGKNVYKALKRISGKEKRWTKDANHKLSRQIVNIAKDNKAVIAIENLKGIRERIKATKRVRRMLHNWNFRQLISFIEYKARLDGLCCVSIDPRGTSRKCSACGYTEKSNRKSQSRFKCSNCGLELNADLNAARNIADRALESLPSGYMLEGAGGLALPEVGLAHNLASSA
ncbi:transposase [bacterium]|nr:transposase [bacterium]